MGNRAERRVSIASVRYLNPELILLTQVVAGLLRYSRLTLMHLQFEVLDLWEELKQRLSTGLEQRSFANICFGFTFLSLAIDLKKSSLYFLNQ